MWCDLGFVDLKIERVFQEDVSTFFEKLTVDLEQAREFRVGVHSDAFRHDKHALEDIDT